MFHKFMAIIIALLFLMIFTGHIDYYSGFNHAQDAAYPTHRASSGFAYLYLLAGFSCFCLFFPNNVAEKLSPKVGGLREVLLKADFWVIVGYLGTCVTLFLLEAFK